MKWHELQSKVPTTADQKVEPRRELTFTGFLGSSDSKESACNAADLGSIPGLGRSPGGGHGRSLQCSCLENPMDRGAWRATVHGVTKSRTQLSNHRLEITLSRYEHITLLDLNTLCDGHFFLSYWWWTWGLERVRNYLRSPSKWGGEL